MFFHNTSSHPMETEGTGLGGSLTGISLGDGQKTPENRIAAKTVIIANEAMIKHAFLFCFKVLKEQLARILRNLLLAARLTF